MSIQDDETLQMYLEESLEHLADIENDFLEIESNGANIDENLVNKVYRAAHSIKGGAGFMGLNNIKDLTHEMENILGKIRSREMVPTPEIVNVLLNASDTLKDLLNDILNSNDVDIQQDVDALRAVLNGEHVPSAKGAPSEAAAPPATDIPSTKAQAETPPMEAAPVASGTGDPERLSVAFPGTNESLMVAQSKLTDLFEQNKYIYLVKINTNDDILVHQKTCQSVIEEMEQTGVLISANFALPPLSDIDDKWRPDVPVMLFLFGTILKPEDINVLFEIPSDQIFEVRPDNRLYNLNGEGLASAGAEDKPALPTETVSEPPASGPLTDEDLPVMTAPEPPVAENPAAAYADTIDSVSTAAPTEDPMNIATPMDGSPMEKDGFKKTNRVEHETSLRVHVSLLDQLMTLAGELVLSRNQLLQSMSSSDQRGSEIAGQRIDLITSELQEAIMLTRMQSIGNVFNKFPRVVRDLARTLNKKIELTLEGKDVELDKTIIEAIGDPLTHLVRNAVDHGIETPDVRKRFRKPPVGQIYLKAYHEAGQVNIEIVDDGQGLDGNKLAAKAVEKGLMTEEQIKVMSQREKTNLIFLPGFSTAEKVTDVSGRGVGMDVVKTNLDKLGGIIDIDSEPGKGTTIRIKLPLTLAIIPCQIVLTGGERYAIPQVNLEELLRIPANQVQNRIERVGDADVVRLRGNLLPLIRLSRVIGVDALYTDPKTGDENADRRKSLTDRRGRKSPLVPAGEPVPDSDESEEELSAKDKKRREKEDRRYHSESALNIVVVSTGAMKYGLVVDDLQDSEEIVVKPLGRDLKQCKGYAGATIMGDGRVALILDVSNLAQMAGLATVEGTARAAEIAESERESKRAEKDKQSLLVFRSAEDEQFAAPLNLVERIEKIKRSDIEEVGGKQVIKYRGGTLPLFSISDAAMVKPLADAENLLVIVFVVANREIGLLSIGPVDAIDTRLEIDGSTLRQTGIMGSAIINGNTTLLIDIVEIIQTLNPQWFEEVDLSDEAGEMATILFAEDSTFFRNQVKGTMEQSGFTVLEAEDGLIAWDLLQENADKISLVVTDIEMPNLDGFALTQKIKQSAAFAHLPVIALTTLAGEEDIIRGKEVGIDDYQIKLDREKLMQSIRDYLKAA